MAVGQATLRKVGGAPSHLGKAGHLVGMFLGIWGRQQLNASPALSSPLPRCRRDGTSSRGAAVLGDGKEEPTPPFTTNKRRCRCWWEMLEVSLRQVHRVSSQGNTAFPL